MHRGIGQQSIRNTFCPPTPTIFREYEDCVADAHLVNCQIVLKGQQKATLKSDFSDDYL